MLYADVESHRKKRGEDPLADEGEDEEGNELTGTEINKLYSKLSKKKETKSAQRTTNIVGKKKEFKPKTKPLGKPKEVKPVEKPKLVSKSEKEQKRNLRLEEQINKSMGATFEFLGGLIERSKKIH